jgi:hypothetical protein
MMDSKDKTAIITIVAYNYLPQALALHESLKGSGVRFVIVLVEPLDSCDLPADLEFYYAEEIIGDAFASMSFMYSIIELCTNIKPAILMHFLNESDYTYYIDPDIYFYQNPCLINNFFNTSDVLLTPHSLTPILDGFSPSEMEFMRTGVFNLGFIGLRKSPNSLIFLNWWHERCVNYGLNETFSGLFVDQKFIDLSISFFDFISICRNFGLNVGYWNLHERYVSEINNEYFIGDDKLIFFHFSGLNPSNPASISKHQNRYSLESRADLNNIFNDYSKKLINFRRNLTKTEIPFCKFDNNLFISNFARRFYWKYKSRYSPEDIFSSSSNLYHDLSTHGLVSKTDKQYQASFGSQSDFSNFGLQIRIFDFLLKILLKLIGPARFWNLIRFSIQRFSTVSKFYLW